MESESKVSDPSTTWIIPYVSNEVETIKKLKLDGYVYNHQRLYQPGHIISVELVSQEEAKWFGSMGKNAIIDFPMHLQPSKATTGMVLLPFIVTEFVNIPPAYVIGPHVRETKWIPIAPYHVLHKDLEKKRRIDPLYHYQFSLERALVWNSFRIYKFIETTTNTEDLKVDITLGYERHEYCTMDLDMFMQHKVYLLELHWLDNQVCFAYDWEQAEDHPESPFRQWTSFDLYNPTTRIWMRDIRYSHYINPIDSAHFFLLNPEEDNNILTRTPPRPDFTWFSWIPLSYLFMNITPNDSMNHIVQHIDGNPKNLCLFNMKRKTNNLAMDLYIRYNIQSKTEQIARYRLLSKSKQLKACGYSYFNKFVQPSEEEEKETDNKKRDQMASDRDLDYNNRQKEIRKKRLQARYEIIQHFKTHAQSLKAENPNARLMLMYPGEFPSLEVLPLLPPGTNKVTRRTLISMAEKATYATSEVEFDYIDI